MVSNGVCVFFKLLQFGYVGEEFLVCNPKFWDLKLHY